MQASRHIALMGTLCIAVFASACGTSNSGGGGGGGGTSGDLSGCKGTVTVASDLPLTGGDSTDGPPVQEAVQLAVDQANANKVLGGCTLKYVSKDDSSVAKNGHDPAQGAANLTALVNDSSVMGVIGPFNSTVAEAEIPLASRGHLAMISPSNTNPGLTQVGSNPLLDTASLYPGPHTYFRVIATDSDQAAILAFVATNQLHYSKAYVIDDQELYGAGISTIFKQDFQKDGGTVVGTASLPGSTKQYQTQVADAQGKGADLLFFGGTTGNGCGIAANQWNQGAHFMGGDGCQDSKFITDAAAGAEGAQATSAPDVSKLSSSAKFYSDFTAKYGSKDSTEPYIAYGYDAMNILIQAIKNALLANGGQPPSDTNTFRDAVVSQLKQTQYDGAIGHTSFDSNGDTLNTGFTLYQSTSGAWKPVGTYTVASDGSVKKS